jgi:peroxiredoxin
MTQAPLPLAVTCLSAFLLFSNPAHAQQFGSFGSRPSRDVVVPSFSDEDVARALATLDRRLAEAGEGGSGQQTAERIYLDFTRYLQGGVLTESQHERLGAHLTRLAGVRPSEAPALGRARDILTRFAIGSTAPDIVGTDLEGHALKLSDYRGKVVVLMFGGEWCGICRTEYPYLRLLTEVYGNWPLAILGVNSDASRETALKASEERGIQNRVWWDGHEARSTAGPIARAWRIAGWPTTYVIDAEGVIRFVDLRQDDLVRGVKQLMTELSRTLERGGALEGR